MAQKTLIEALEEFYNKVVNLGIDRPRAANVLKKAFDVLTNKNYVICKEGTCYEVEEKKFNELLDLLEKKAKTLTRKVADGDVIFFDKQNINKSFKYDSLQSLLSFLCKDMMKDCERIRANGLKKKIGEVAERPKAVAC